MVTELLRHGDAFEDTCLLSSLWTVQRIMSMSNVMLTVFPGTGLVDFSPVVRARWAPGGAYLVPRPDVLFMIFQEERTTTTHRLHFQVYAELNSRMGYTTVQGLFGAGCHVERRMGTQLQAIGYVTKVDTRVVGGFSGSVGTPRAPRGRPPNSMSKAFQIMAGRIQDGEKLDVVMHDNPGASAMFPGQLATFYIKQKGERDWPMDVQIFVGLTGTGKSSLAKRENPGAYWGSWPEGDIWWWQEYEGQDCVVLDDFFHQLSMTKMMELFDRHHMRVSVKYGSAEMVSRKVVITTNVDPKDWFQYVTMERRLPLERRIREFGTVFDFGDGGVFPDFDKVARTEEFFFNPTLERPVRGGRTLRSPDANRM